MLPGSIVTMVPLQSPTLASAALQITPDLARPVRSGPVLCQELRTPPDPSLAPPDLFRTLRTPQDPFGTLRTPFGPLRTPPDPSGPIWDPPDLSCGAPPPPHFQTVAQQQPVEQSVPLPIPQDHSRASGSPLGPPGPFSDPLWTPAASHKVARPVRSGPVLCQSCLLIFFTTSLYSVV